MFRKQGWHFLSLVALLIGATALARGEVLTGQLWGIRKFGCGSQSLSRSLIRLLLV